MRRAAVVLAALVLFSLPAMLHAQVAGTASARIRVVDANNDDAIEGAQVSFPGLSIGALTNRDGMAVLQGIPPGDHAFRVAMIGYGTASGVLHLEPGAVAEDVVALAVQPFEIAGIRVDGRRRWSTNLDRAGFYERSQLSFGDHLDREALQRRNPIRVDWAIEHLLRPGCKGEGKGAWGDSDRATTTFGRSGGPIPTQTMGAANDRPVVFVDGVWWREELEHLPLTWVEGVEVYRSAAGTPPQYAGWARCGVVLIWTG